MHSIFNNVLTQNMHHKMFTIKEPKNYNNIANSIVVTIALFCNLKWIICFIQLLSLPFMLKNHWLELFLNNLPKFHPIAKLFLFLFFNYPPYIVILFRSQKLRPNRFKTSIILTKFNVFPLHFHSRTYLFRPPSSGIIQLAVLGITPQYSIIKSSLIHIYFYNIHTIPSGHIHCTSLSH